MFSGVTARRMHILLPLVNDFLEEKRTFVTRFFLWESDYCLVHHEYDGSRRVVWRSPAGTKYSDPPGAKRRVVQRLSAIGRSRCGVRNGPMLLLESPHCGAVP